MLIVTQSGDGKFSCIKEGDVGMCIEGRGASVLEAVGSWAIYSQTVSIKCVPPSVLREFSVAMKYADLRFTAAPSRD